jgi:hypothetical protein
MAEEIKITVPIAFTVALIIRHNQAISENEARELAHELHDLVAAVQAATPHTRLTRPRWSSV